MQYKMHHAFSKHGSNTAILMLCNLVFCRRRTPHASPQACNLPAAVDFAADKHCLRPAGPVTSDHPPNASTSSQRGNSLQDVDANAIGRSYGFQHADREEMEVLDRISPDDIDTDHVDTGKPSAMHREIASHSQRRGLFSSSEAPAGEEERAYACAQMQTLQARQQAAAGHDTEQPRQRQTARQGRDRAVGHVLRAMQGLPTSTMPVTLDSDRFGFVKLPATRYAKS